jgi:hypothetical protein
LSEYASNNLKYNPPNNNEDINSHEDGIVKVVNKAVYEVKERDFIALVKESNVEQAFI